MLPVFRLIVVDRMNFKFIWEPGEAPLLIQNDETAVRGVVPRKVFCYPHYNMPFIHTSKARGNPNAVIEQSGRNKPTIHPRTSKPKSEEGEEFQEIMSEEMKGLEDLIPGDAGASSSSDDAGRQADAENSAIPPPPVPKGKAGGNPERERKLCG